MPVGYSLGLSATMVAFRISCHYSRCCLQTLHLDRTVDCFSPLTACIALSHTIRAISQGGDFQVIYSSIPPSLLSESWSVFSNGVLHSVPEKATKSNGGNNLYYFWVLLASLDQEFKSKREWYKCGMSKESDFYLWKLDTVFSSWTVYLKLGIISPWRWGMFLSLHCILSYPTRVGPKFKQYLYTCLIGNYKSNKYKTTKCIKVKFLSSNLFIIVFNSLQNTGINHCVLTVKGDWEWPENILVLLGKLFEFADAESH